MLSSQYRMGTFFFIYAGLSVGIVLNMSLYSQQISLNWVQSFILGACIGSGVSLFIRGAHRRR
jgi:hypothetical protein